MSYDEAFRIIMGLSIFAIFGIGVLVLIWRLD
jgi:hypothetical protein